MKKYTLFLITLLISTSLFAQFKKVESQKEEKIGKVQNFEIIKRGEHYVVTYSDAKFVQLDEYKSFVLNEEEFNQLYEIIQKGLQEVPKDKVDIENDDFILSIEFVKMMGVRSLKMFHYDKKTTIAGVTGYLTKRQVAKLFGKKKKKK